MSVGSGMLLHLPSLAHRPDSPGRGPEQFWRDVVSRPLEAALRSNCGLTDAEARLHARFFRLHLARWLGPGARLDGVARPGHGSAMTNDHTPFEFSYAWKGSGEAAAAPGFRLIMDVAPPTVPASRAETLAAALEAVRTLGLLAARPAGPGGLRLDMFPELCEGVTRHLLHREPAIHAGKCPRCDPSSTFLGFELGPGRAAVKAYWRLPSCLSVASAVDELDGLFAACRPADALFAGAAFAQAWQLVRGRVLASAERLVPRMVSVDATRHPRVRLKIYTRCYLGREPDPLEAVMAHLTLDGRVPLTADFRTTVAAVWHALTQTARPRYVLLLHEIGVQGPASEPALGAKLYIMCGQLDVSDAAIARQLLQHCAVLGNDALMRSLASSEHVTGNMAEIGFAPRGDQTEVGIYLNPALYTPRSELVGEDGTVRRKCLF